MKRRNTWRPWLDPVGLVARLLLAVIALSTAVEVLEATTSLREERLSFLGISAVGELDLILGLLMLVSGTLVLAGLWTRAAVIGVLLTWWPSFLVPEDGSDWIATLAVGGLAIHLLQRGADRFSVDWALETPQDQPSILRQPCTVDAQDDLV
jgi:uncharacterized membrane protein YphA (DoxX/SURF4 family)